MSDAIQKMKIDFQQTATNPHSSLKKKQFQSIMLIIVPKLRGRIDEDMRIFFRDPVMKEGELVQHLL